MHLIHHYWVIIMRIDCNYLKLTITFDFLSVSTVELYRPAPACLPAWLCLCVCLLVCAADECTLMRANTHGHTHTHSQLMADYTQLAVRPNVCSKLLRSSAKHSELCRLLLAPASATTTDRQTSRVYVCASAFSCCCRPSRCYCSCSGCCCFSLCALLLCCPWATLPPPRAAAFKTKKIAHGSCI